MLKLQIEYNAEWEEYRVACYEHGNYSEERTYFTDDKQDAIDTLEYNIRELLRKGITDVVINRRITRVTH